MADQLKFGSPFFFPPPSSPFLSSLEGLAGTRDLAIGRQEGGNFSPPPFSLLVSPLFPALAAREQRDRIFNAFVDYEA